MSPEPDAAKARSLIAASREARARGDDEVALSRYREAVAVLRPLGADAVLAHAIRHVADLLRAMGHIAEAAPLSAEMLVLYRSLPDAPPLDLANAVRSAAVQAEAAGDRERARRLWAEARDLYVPLTGLIETMSGQPGNPGVDEAELRLEALA